LPAAGYRDYNNGSPFRQGSNGYYRSSTATSSNAKFLNMSYDSQGMSDDHRTYGFSVRCVAAEF
jgi:hypothetical protein